MRKKELSLEEEITMREAIENQISISEQEEAHAVLEAKYNSAEEAVEQDSLRAQGWAEEIFEDDVMEEYYIEENDAEDWGNACDNPYYDDNLDMDQQSPEFWDNL